MRLVSGHVWRHTWQPKFHVIFRPPQIYLGQENHNLCCVFFNKFCQFSLFHSVLFITSLS